MASGADARFSPTSQTRQPALPSDRFHWILGALILLVWAAASFWQYVGTWPGDLSGLYFAGHFYGQGDLAQVYASPARFFGNDYPEVWRQYAAALGYGHQPVYPFIYPPLWAVLAAPVSQTLAPHEFFNVARAVEIGLLAWSVGLAHRLWGQDISFTRWSLVSTALLATSIPVLQALSHAQPQIIVTFLILLGFERVARGRPIAGGTALALAASIKLTPVLLVVILIAGGDRRAVVAFVVAGSALAGASLMLAGLPLHLTFLDQLGLAAQQLPLLDFSYSAQAAVYELATFIRQAGAVKLGVYSVVLLSPPRWFGLGAILVAIGAIAVAMAQTRKLPADRARAQRLVAIYTLATLAMPIAWSHHFLLPLLAIPVLARAGAGQRSWLALIAAGAVLSKYSLLVTAPDNAALHWHALTGSLTMLAFAVAFSLRDFRTS